ncbi:ATP-dependent RNA helicase ddx39a [Saguinus oedipus]|uniref:ATP-dependent RNA helicase ddx39a n=1 Tax=Saguinus oedipus TaxID=9490 RepID=A0ABQ9VT48_SAGOE|nr:ATP-dependent RNA helicase ddx39a [Saguinus oedipus]
MQDPMEVLVDEIKHMLHAPQQYYLKLKDAEKNCKLFHLLGMLEFKHVAIFKKPLHRCMSPIQLLMEQKFPAMA